MAGTENEITFDALTPIEATSDGKPDCTVEPTIDKNGTDFLFLPFGCDPGTTCTGVRAFVLALDNTTPIPSGSALYECAVRIASNATLGTYPLQNGNAVASDPLGQPVTARGVAGEVEVICAGDCDHDLRVAIFELVRGVNILLGTDSLTSCPDYDSDESGRVGVQELVQSVSSALRGCGAISGAEL